MTIVSSTGSSSYQNANMWIVDSGATKHMTKVWDIFLSIVETSLGYYVESRMNGLRAIRGVVTIRFRLEFGETLKVDGGLFVPRMDFKLLSVSALDDERYGVLFRSGHVFLCPESRSGRNHVAT